MKKRISFFRVAKVTYLFATGLIMAVMLLFTPTFSKFEKTGDNLYTVSLNGTVIGTCQDTAVVDELIVKARRELAKDSGEMLYIPVDVEAVGQEVLIGEVDSEKYLFSNIMEVMKNSVRQTLKHAYTVKINEYMVNLASSEDVTALLEAALERYDTDNLFDVGLVMDPERELNVLTTSVYRRDEEEEKASQSEGAGVAGYFEEVFAEIEPSLALRDFASLDYGLVDIDFGDPVEIVDAYLPENEISGLEDAIAEVTADQEKEQIYEVKSGDTLSQIAEDNNIPMDELIAINPILESERSMIRVGDELIITIPEPELSVVYSQRIYEEDSYEAEIVYVDNDSWYTNQTKVLQQPSAGFRKAAAVVTYRNNMEISEEIVKEDVIYEAVPKIVERGTKIPPTFIKPISGGRLSSSFGRRSAPTKGASTYHKGVDWAVPTGTAVMASCGGTVTRAGWASGYGYVVYIQHEGGRETRYGHLSKVLVSVGQKVSQGQKIALSGNTGRSTGPHLHFEILINGAAVDPYKYMS